MEKQKKRKGHKKNEGQKEKREIMRQADIQRKDKEIWRGAGRQSINRRNINEN